MKFEINMVVEVDEDSNILEVDRQGNQEVVLDLANARGWNLDEALYRVHSNNLGRMYQPDGSIKGREDGKIVKNKAYPKPDLSDLV